MTFMTLIVLLLFASSSTFAQLLNVKYGIKGGLTASTRQVADYDGGPGITETTYGHSYVGPNLGLFCKLNNFILADVSFVFKGKQQTDDEIWEPLTFTSLALYLKWPTRLYPFFGIHKDYLVFTSSSKYDDDLGKLRKSNWSYSFGLGFDNIDFNHKLFLIEVKMDMLSKRSLYKLDDPTVRLISGDIKLGLYLK